MSEEDLKKNVPLAHSSAGVQLRKQPYSSRGGCAPRLEGCRLCPRNCGTPRRKGRTGLCRETEVMRVARAALHFWEEPCISGEEGSGAVFFTGCSLRCSYCQNYEISRGLPEGEEARDRERDRERDASGKRESSGEPPAETREKAGTAAAPGKPVTAAQLSDIFLSLQKQGANNINLVTACHFVPQVRAALLLARQKDLRIPVVYNSSGYEKTETLRLLDGLVDIYLPDFKYLDGALAAQYSRAPDYPEAAKAALAEMVRQCPEPVFDARGIMQKGVIVRHLLLPGHVREAKQIVAYLHQEYGNRIYISLMNQYTPGPAVREDPLLGRKVTRREYGRLLDYALELGVEQGFYQEGGTVGESFIPAFDLTGVADAKESLCAANRENW